MTSYERCGQSTQLILMRRSKTQPRPAHPHTFQLKPLVSTALNQTITANFSPPRPNPSQNAAPNAPNAPNCKLTLSIIPRFNNDRKHYTSAFINPFVEEDDSYLQASHNTKVRESTRQIWGQDILVSKPRKGATCYCCVCRCYYQDYLEHVQSSYHEQKGRDTPFSKHIHQLVRRLKHSQKKEPQRGVLTRSARRRISPWDLQKEEAEQGKHKKVILWVSLSSGSVLASERSEEKAWGRWEGEGEGEGKRELSTVPKSEALLID